MKKLYWRAVIGVAVGAAAGYIIDLATGQFGVWLSLGAGVGAGVGAALDQVAQPQRANPINS